jgi:hypothetical protein
MRLANLPAASTAEPRYRYPVRVPGWNPHTTRLRQGPDREAQKPSDL